MFKHIILIIVLSVAIVLGTPYASQGVQWLLQAHDWIANVLTDIFSGGQSGNIARGLIALLSVPVLVAAIPALIYWGVKRHFFPYFMVIVWVLWLVQAGAILVAHPTMTITTN